MAATPENRFVSPTNFSRLQSFTKIPVLVLLCVFLQTGPVRAARQLDEGSSKDHKIVNLRDLLVTASNQHRGIGMKVFHEHASHLKGETLTQDITQKTRAAIIPHSQKHPHKRSGLKSLTVRRQELVGQYYMPLQLGTPGKDILVIIDTGSEILWVQCLPCKKCGPQIIEPVFDPALSSTYRPVSCHSRRCSPQRSNVIQTSCTNTTTTSHSHCTYNVAYGDNSTSAGDLALETLTLNSTTGVPTAIRDFEFGCGHINQGVEDELGASGLMGLDRDERSFISQISNHYSQVFLYCFPDRISSLNSSGFIHFGDSYVSKHLRYTPLLQNNASAFLSKLYFVNVTGISVNGNLLPIPQKAFLIDVSGNGGTFMDTGSSYSTLVDPALHLLKGAFLSHIQHLKRTIDPLGIGLEVCFNISASATHLPKVPLVSFHLEGEGVELRLSAENLWLIAGVDDEHVTVCLAIRSAGPVGIGNNVIGNYQQANHIIEIDIEHSRVGIADANCAID